MTTYGWWYEDAHWYGGDSEDLWDVVGQGVEQAAADGQLADLRVGELVDLHVDEMIDEEDVVDLLDNEALSAQHLCEVVSERCGDRVEDGCAYLAVSPEVAEASLREILRHDFDRSPAASLVVRWASEHITLDPVQCFEGGRHPLPIEWIEGEWLYGHQDAEPPEAAATVMYTTQPSPETGHVGWCWWALGKMGEAPSLREAMARAETIVRRAMGEEVRR